MALQNIQARTVVNRPCLCNQNLTNQRITTRQAAADIRSGVDGRSYISISAVKTLHGVLVAWPSIASDRHPHRHVDLRTQYANN